ncbi:MAG: DUF4861 family protein [Verrucomicrobiota bacterium]
MITHIRILCLFGLGIFPLAAFCADDVLVHCRFVPERADDFAWENDLIAFRAYGPTLKDSGEDSGFDAWLKRVEYPIIDKWYAGNAAGKSYHTDHGEGYDPYKVGSSRGCGGLGLWIDGQLVTSNVFDEWEILKLEGDEAVFVLSYQWEHGGHAYKERKEISIESGKRLFRSRSTFTKDGELAAGLPIAIGLVRHHDDDLVAHDLDEGWMSIWETIDGSGLGTGVVIHPGAVDEFVFLESDEPLGDHALLIAKTDDQGILEYHAGYGWERAGAITDPREWNAYLSGFSAGQ